MGFARRLGSAVLALVLPAGLAAAASAYFFPLSTVRMDPDEGRQIFERRCATCHSASDGQPSPFGPPLAHIGQQAATRKEGLTAEEYLLESVVNPAAFQPPGVPGVMPANVANDLRQDQVLSLVAFLAGRGAKPNYPRLLELVAKIPPPRLEDKLRYKLADMLAGADLFWNKFKCIQCHDLDESPSSHLLAPSLVRVGKHQHSYLREAIQDPSKHFAPGYETTLVVTAQGQIVTGRRLASPPGSVRLLYAAPEGGIAVEEFREEELEPLAEEGTERVGRSSLSAMPRYEQMSAEELDRLVDFLSTLR